MKTTGRVLLAALLAAFLAQTAWADRDRHYPRHHHPRSSVHFGLSIGTPWPLMPPYPTYPYYPHSVYWPHLHAPPARVVVVPPPVYIEQQQAVPALEPGYWYYCSESQAYFPYVKQCAGPWQKVSPRPPQ